ncbi:hypothetical protein GCM10010156_68450 [Planobispora rosea]|uniref:Molecular chaperone DnaJ n=1 Tax=Planobispora rosea TaxID=35762 RepID=A0A8J3WG86_PLARO|nr:hypothetical protein [Planobispora rosea]GGT00670.1 hypothetical protein GCM10010156_68450 [Planobispora rosea]GIH88173.1 hypothetical protein Pro02_65810 [Planobispora rosea]
MIHAYTCATCAGTGLVNDDSDSSPYQLSATCPDCDGTGIDN